MKSVHSCMVAILAAAPALAQLPEPPRRPNVIVVLCDDYGYNDVGAYTYPSPADYYPNSGPPPNFPETDPDIPAPNMARTLTPRLDVMAAQGMRFTGFYSCARNCTPARASLMTGCYAKRVSMPAVINPTSNRGLNTTEITLPEILKTAGYATGMVGKWHLGYAPDQARSTQFLPTRQGFDEYLGLPYSNDMFQRELFLIEDETPIESMGTSQSNTGVHQHKLIWRYTERALDFIERNQAGPFFLYLAHSMPHIPVFPSQTTFPNADGTTWPVFQGASGISWYYDIVMEIDHSMGRIFDMLQVLGIDDETLVIFTSDNGPWLKLSNVDLDDRAVGSAYPLRESKSTTWEGGPRVPCIARWPGMIPAGVTDEVGGLIDLLPTLAKLAGAEAPGDRVTDGKDLWPVLSGQPGAVSPHPELYYYSNSAIHAVRQGAWKLRRVSGTSTLYNLDDDIQERTNKVLDEPGLTTTLEGVLTAFDADLVANQRPQGTYSDQEIVVDTNRLTVGEGDTTTCRVKLAMDPGGTVQVDSRYLFGEAAVTVTGGAVLSFDSGNWDSFQTVTITAGEDPDTIDEGAIVRCSSSSFQPVREIFVSTIDNDTVPAVEVGFMWPKAGAVNLAGTPCLLHAEAAASINGVPDPPGTTYAWSVAAGLPGVMFTDAAAPATGVLFPADGDYTIRLEASFAGAVTGSGEFEVTVGATPVTLPGATLVYDAAADDDGDATWEELAGTGGRNWTLATGGNAVTRTAGDAAPSQPGLGNAYVFRGGAIPAGANSLHFDAFSSGDASIELWFKPDDPGAAGAQVVWETGGDIGASLTRNGAQLSFAVDDGGGSAATGAIATATVTAAPGYDGFIQAVGVIDLANDLARLFVNGSETATAGIPAVNDWCGSSYTGLGTIAQSNGGESTSLGHLGGNDLLGAGLFGTFAGQVALCRFYDRALTPAEIQALFTNVATENVAPQVDAGSDQSIAFTGSAALAGSASDDGQPAGSVPAALWSQGGGPGRAAIAAPLQAVTTATFDLPGSYTMRLDADDSEVRVYDEAVVTVAPLTYAEWAAAVPFAPGDGDPGDNPDGDPWENIWEWTLGSDPLTDSPGQAGIAFTGEALGPVQRLTLEFDKPRDRQPAITFHESDDLFAWDPVVTPLPSVVPVSDTHERWTFTYEVPATEPRWFLRAEVSE